MAYDFYNAYLSITSSPKQSFRDEFQANVNGLFEIASDYFVIQKLNRTTQELEDIGVRLTFPYSLKEQSTIKDDFRKIIFKDDTSEPKLGDLYLFNNYYYLCIDTGTNESVSTTCIVQRCNVVLKFTETSATPLSSYDMTIYGVSSRYAMNSLSSGQFITLPDNQVEVSIPNDVNSRKIKYAPKPTRFLIGNPYKNFKVISIDSISKVRPNVTGEYDNGIIILKLELTQINPKDDLTNGIAWQDYF